MASEKSSAEYFRDQSIEAEQQSLINPSQRQTTSESWFTSRSHIVALYTSNLLLVLILFFSTIALDHRLSADPTLGVYSPANNAVEYIKEHKFRAALFNNTPYMGYPSDETDRLWSELYNFGISRISAEEAEQLPNPTLAIPGTQDYLIELDVWHELHCLNDLRKLLYPERFEGLEELKDENGIINRDTDPFRHWDHCVDSIRQTLMCHADISPIPFHVNVPANGGIFPRLATTHTCRNFTKIQQWSKDHFAGVWDYNLTSEQAEEIIRTASVDQSPDEDIEFMYDQFPGNTWFRYWREHPEEAAEARKKVALGGI